MQRDPRPETEERGDRDRGAPDAPPPETAEHPVPGVEHEPEPDAENLMPAEDRPGTF
ncbi:MAG TPA: hypothetical protein VGR37_24350 [Longimicrobiaceae bacterium]|nr:hypothetical protein [Longimicrobiaceae bacterium]